MCSFLLKIGADTSSVAFMLMTFTPGNDTNIINPITTATLRIGGTIILMYTLEMGVLFLIESVSC